MTKETTGTNKGKDVIYIDVDDEITGIIEKVQNSEQRIVALVLPKRATMLQSAVNMKLLKRAGEKSKKHVVLITSEAGLMPLAGSVGLHVAKSLQSKPEIPEAPKAAAVAADETEPVDAGDEPEIDRSKPVGELTGDDEDEAIELDNSAEAEAAENATEGGKDKKAAKEKGAKKFKIPNFNKFRTWLLVGGVAAIALIGFVVWALITMPRAEVVIATDSSAIVSSREITLLTSEDAELDAEAGEIPAQREEIVRTQREQVDASGEENRGDQAEGKVTISLDDCSEPEVTIPAGVGISADGKTFITQESATVERMMQGNQCVNSQHPNVSTDTVSVVAQRPGAEYNIGPSSFTLSGYSNVSVESEKSMKGGTDDIVKIVTQQDIDRAKDRIRDREAENIEQELHEALEDAGLLPIEATFNVMTDDTETSADPGDEEDSVTVTEEVTYSMLGISQEDLEAVVAADVADDINAERQIILDYGLGEATFNMQNQQGDRTLVGMRTVVVAGPDLDVDVIKEDVAGKKASEARSAIAVNPGVTNVDVTYGPFWVRAIPKNINKITVVIEEPETVVDRDDTDAEDDAEPEE